MKTVAIVVSFALHLGALYVVPGNDARDSTENGDAVKTTQSSAESCKCDLEMSADCSQIVESR